ncbi:unnamed protein product [Orchesella dallaii]|uniref:Uncharacterized protein n=1 Tax=Orchesella dallaii TaxID=48710 RepID=A0ABP1RQ15_9HEXA
MLLKPFSVLLVFVLGCALALAVPLTKDEETSPLSPSPTEIIPQNSTETEISSDSSSPSNLETESNKTSSTTPPPSVHIGLSGSPGNGSTFVEIQNDSQNSTLEMGTGAIPSTSTTTTQAPIEIGKEPLPIYSRRPVHVMIIRKKLPENEAKSQNAPGEKKKKSEENLKEEEDFSEEEEQEEDEDFDDDDDDDDDKRSEKLRTKIVNGHASPWACDESKKTEKVDINME